MDRINRAQVMEHTTHHFTTEASDLGWPPGHWPDRVETDLGNGQSLVLKQINSEQALYEQVAGCIEVTVYND